MNLKNVLGGISNLKHVMVKQCTSKHTASKPSIEIKKNYSKLDTSNILRKGTVDSI